MAVLGHDRLWKLLTHEDLEQRLIVTPLMTKSQVGPASLDIRLGNDFIITRRGNLACIDPAKNDLRSHRYQTKHCINFKQPFYLHPNELVLAATLEYFRLPLSVAATVTSRSSWGRAGLVIATATAVHPGYSGVITLELVNLGEVPLVLYPGLPVAQILFADCEGAIVYDGQFAQHTDARHADLTKDRDADLQFWLPST